ncbi:MAG: hypothetical protein BGO29_04180 [Bacteroidales bacterium 36-12]|nr:MAG: hypothetical protein BGO29_04180 [Bacteroidales bacterium 36-12]
MVLIPAMVSICLNVWSQIPISSVEDLQKIGRDDAYPLQGASYYLTNDIDLTEVDDWVPIGATSASTPGGGQFEGIFDGKGYCIKNLTITSSNAGFKGLFIRLYNSQVKDLDLVNVNIKGSVPVGGISGAMIGETHIERVSVTGTIEGEREVGGIVGRIARNNIKTGYNQIYDCYVNANIKATSQSTNMNEPSCAAGIAAYTHSTQGNSVAKIDIRRVYVTGSITSEQKTNTAGNAAGILAFYDSHNFIKMEEVLVLSDTIGSATSNLFFCRRGATYAEFELFDKVYARTGIILNYLSQTDKGRGGEIPDGIINYLPLADFTTKQFYEDNVSWDFDDVWTMTEGSLPVLKRTPDELTKNSSILEKDKKYMLATDTKGIVLTPVSSEISVQIFSAIGAQLYAVKNLRDQTSIPLSQGIYVVRLSYNGKNAVEKIIVR